MSHLSGHNCTLHTKLFMYIIRKNMQGMMHLSSLHKLFKSFTAPTQVGIGLKVIGGQFSRHKLGLMC